VQATRWTPPGRYRKGRSSNPNRRGVEMPRRTNGSVYKTADGYGIRWPENGERPHQAGFRTKTEALDWFDENVAPRLRRGRPSGDVPLKAFSADYLQRWGVDVQPRTKATMEEWLEPALARFGRFTLRELERAADDISQWRSKLPTEHALQEHQGVAAAPRRRPAMGIHGTEPGRG